MVSTSHVCVAVLVFLSRDRTTGWYRPMVRERAYGPAPPANRRDPQSDEFGGGLVDRNARGLQLVHETRLQRAGINTFLCQIGIELVDLDIQRLQASQSGTIEVGIAGARHRKRSGKKRGNQD